MKIVYMLQCKEWNRISKLLNLTNIISRCRLYDPRTYEIGYIMLLSQYFGRPAPLSQNYMAAQDFHGCTESDKPLHHIE